MKGEERNKTAERSPCKVERAMKRKSLLFSSRLSSSCEQSINGKQTRRREKRVREAEKKKRDILFRTREERWTYGDKKKEGKTSRDPWKRVWEIPEVYIHLSNDYGLLSFSVSLRASLPSLFLGVCLVLFSLFSSSSSFPGISTYTYTASLLCLSASLSL